MSSVAVEDFSEEVEAGPAQIHYKTMGCDEYIKDKLTDFIELVTNGPAT